MIDVSQVKADVKVRLPDGSVGEVKGSYLSTEGLVLRVQMSAGAIVTRNVPIERILEIVTETKRED